MDKAQIPRLTKLAVAVNAMVWVRYCELFPKLKLAGAPSIVLNNRLKSTGGRIYCETRKCELSTELFYYNEQEFIDVIIPHELAHQVNHDLYAGWMHDATWKRVMIAYGLPPNPYHNMVNPLQDARNAAKIPS